MKLFKLRKGTSIPSGIGIERDGPNHVCMYPHDSHLEISNISGGFEAFEVNCFQPLANSWKPYALVRCAGGGFCFPRWFPPSDDLFPLHAWLEYVILYGPSDAALRTSYAISDFISSVSYEFTSQELIATECFFLKLLQSAEQYFMVCTDRHLDTNIRMTKALKMSLSSFNAYSGSF